MKHTDIALLFVMIMVISVIPFEYRLSLLREAYRHKVICNNILDTAVEDTLRESFEVEHSGAYINPEKACSFFIREVQEVMTLGGDEFPVILISNAEGFWICSFNDSKNIEWRAYDKPYDNEAKINMMRNVLEEALYSESSDRKYTVSIPYIQAEEWYNTISDNGLLAVYRKTYDGMKILGSRYEQLIFSGACVRKIVAV